MSPLPPPLPPTRTPPHPQLGKQYSPRSNQPDFTPDDLQPSLAMRLINPMAKRYDSVTSSSSDKDKAPDSVIYNRDQAP